MILEIGKTYKMKNGGNVKIERFEENETFPFFGHIKNTQYDRLAYFSINGKYSYTPSEFDIIEEINNG